MNKIKKSLNPTFGTTYHHEQHQISSSNEYKQHYLNLKMLLSKPDSYGKTPIFYLLGNLNYYSNYQILIYHN